MYDKVATQHDKIDDFRAKLLALLPVATGIGLFALVKEPPNNIDFLFSMALFGAIASFGLFIETLFIGYGKRASVNATEPRWTGLVICKLRANY